MIRSRALVVAAALLLLGGCAHAPHPTTAANNLTELSTGSLVGTTWRGRGDVMGPATETYTFSSGGVGKRVVQEPDAYSSKMDSCAISWRVDDATHLSIYGSCYKTTLALENGTLVDSGASIVAKVHSLVSGG